MQGGFRLSTTSVSREVKWDEEGEEIRWTLARSSERVRGRVIQAQKCRGETATGKLMEMQGALKHAQRKSYLSCICI